MVGAFAEFERAMIRERTSAGLAAAGQRAALVAGRRSWTTPNGVRLPRRSSRAGKPQHRWRGCSACRHQLCHGSSPLMWLVRSYRSGIPRSLAKSNGAFEMRSSGCALQ